MKFALLAFMISCAVGILIYFALLVILIEKRSKFPFTHSGTNGKFIILGSLLFCLVFQLIMNFPNIENTEVQEYMVMLNGGLFHYIIYFVIVTRYVI